VESAGQPRDHVRVNTLDDIARRAHDPACKSRRIDDPPYECAYCRLPLPRFPRRRPDDADRRPSDAGQRPGDSPLTLDVKGGEVGGREPAYCCYGCRLAARITQSAGEQGQVVWLLTRLGVALFLSMMVMVLSFFQYGQEVYAADADHASALAFSLAGLLRYLSLLFAAPVLLLLGGPILDNAWGQMRLRVVSTDALIVMGVTAAFVYSCISTFTGRGGTYFETGCMILVLVTLGRWFEATGKLRASAAVQSLESLIPPEVVVQRDGPDGTRTVTLRSNEVQPGDRLLVSAGGRIAADGVIEQGQAHVDEQLVTGESTPAVRREGDLVRAGTLNLDGGLLIRATAAGAESTLGRLLRLLEEAKQRKGRYERLADRISTVFVPLTLVLAIGAAILGARRGGTPEAILSGLAVMLIACPCALGLATPMAVWVAMGRAAAKGALFRTGEVLEVLAGVKAICFDKTGTLTTGQPAVVAVEMRADDQVAEDRRLAAAAGLGAASSHVLSRSLVSHAAARGIRPLSITHPRTVPGRGVLGACDSVDVCLGSVEWMRERELTLEEPLQAAATRLIAEGRSVACLAWDRIVAAVFGFAEELRPEAGPAARQLQELGCRVAVLTGDHRARGEAIARELGVETKSELLPEDKVSLIQQLKADYGPVAMVGDGLNDAPALAAADVGIALGCGADVTRESAGLCLLANDLLELPRLLRLARRTVRTIKQNLFWAFVYNVVGLSLAVTGKLGPVFAAGAMVVSSLLVVTNSLRLGWDRPGCASAGLP